MKKCPPGVICIENFTIIIIIILVVVLCYFLFSKNQNISISTNLRNNEDTGSNQNQNSVFGFLPNFPYNNNNDVLLNPYAPPLRDERYVVPINVSTTAVDTSYRQIGILTPLNGSSKDNILPLMGRPLFTRRSLWQYYTISNQHNNVKLPISFKGRSALNDYGVDQIFSGDTVYVEGYNEPFKVTMYETDTIRYLPFL